MVCLINTGIHGIVSELSKLMEIEPLVVIVKNRICSVCNGNRKAKLIRQYKPIIEQWNDIHFLTLTVSAQPHQDLNKWMTGMIKAFEKI